MNRVSCNHKFETMKLTSIIGGFVTALALFFSINLFAQSTDIGASYWNKTERQLLSSSIGAEQHLNASKADYYGISNYSAIHQAILNSEDNQIIQLPMADGEFHSFKLVRNTTMTTGLAEQFPLIRTYNIISTESRNTWGKLQVSHHGLNALVLIPGESTVYISPVFLNESAAYMVYNRSDFYTDQTFQCQNSDSEVSHNMHQSKSSDPFTECELRTFRIAVAATGEFTSSQGGSVADGMAAIVVTIDDINVVFEREFAATLTIVEDNADVVYTNANTDPFTNSSLGAMLDENQNNMDIVIGSAFYDIGHVFGTIGGGLAQLNSTCSFTGKARGATGSVFGGGPFTASVVAHEFGHQFGAAHSYNNSCNGNVSISTSVEVGAGNTIMSYAGVCFPGPQNYSDDHYNGLSLEQIGDELASDNCGESSPLDNTPPVLADLPNEIFIPISTPFALTVEATDEDGDELTYCWEQMNAFITEQPPLSTAVDGPNFRSFTPNTSATRYLPSSSNGLSTTWEVLAEVARGYFFRVTVRDNAPGGGCNEYADMEVYTIAEAGPFLVEYPNTFGIDWDPFTVETVLWDVANTTIDPINAALVDIFLSVDGGDTYDIQLADDVPNDGAQEVDVPNIETNDARIRVINSDGTFFDVSNSDFTINGFTQGFYFATEDEEADVCQDDVLELLVDIVDVGDFAGEIALSISEQPIDATVVVSPENAFAGDQVTITISNLSTTATGVYPVVLDGVATDFDNVISIDFGVVDVNAVSASPNSPSDGETDIGTFTEFTWSDNATVGITYTLELALDADFNDVVLTEEGLEMASFEYSDLQSATTYFWRITNVSVCGASAPSEVYEFSTVQCALREYTGFTTTIPDNSPEGIESSMFVNLIGQIDDVNVVDITGTHGQMSDLTFSIISPNGTEVQLTSGNCGLYLTIMPNGEIIVEIPESLSGSYECSNSSSFGDPVPGGGISGNLVYAYDDSGNPQALCDAPVNADEVAGNIALVYRGVCNFQTKVLNAQEAGAIAVIVANNQPGDSYFDMGGEDEDIVVSSVMVSNNTGNLFRDNQGGSVEGFSFSFDDQSLNNELPCPPTDSGTYAPEGSLSDFIGENASGTWNLKIADPIPGNTGSLEDWGLEFCFEGGVVVSTADRNQIYATIFPNPSQDFITVQLQEDIATKISLLDIAGRIIETKIPISTKTQFNLSSLADGVYLIKLEGPSFGQSVHKVVKN